MIEGYQKFTYRGILNDSNESPTLVFKEGFYVQVSARADEVGWHANEPSIAGYNVSLDMKREYEEVMRAKPPSWNELGPLERYDWECTVSDFLHDMISYKNSLPATGIYCVCISQRLDNFCCHFFSNRLIFVESVSRDSRFTEANAKSILATGKIANVYTMIMPPDPVAVTVPRLDLSNPIQNTLSDSTPGEVEPQGFLSNRITNIDQVFQGHWHVCGFVTAIQAAYYNGKHELLGGTSFETIFPVIVSFVNDVDKSSDKTLYTEILKFTNDFEKENYHDLDSVVSLLKSDRKMRSAIGITISLNAMIHLCSFLGMNVRKTVTTGVNDNKLVVEHMSCKNAIYGIGYDGTTIHNGVHHWVYVTEEGVMVSWGLKMDLNAGIKMLISFGYNMITHCVEL